MLVGTHAATSSAHCASYASDMYLRDIIIIIVIMVFLFSNLTTT